MIELVVVIVLLGILSIYALSNVFNQDQFAVKGFFDDTVNAMRFAQKLALSSGCAVRVRTTASSFELHQSSTCTAGDFSSAVNNPANRGISYQNSSLPAGFTLTAATIVFNARGVVASGANSTLTVGAYSFIVYGQTGLVDVL